MSRASRSLVFAAAAHLLAALAVPAEAAKIRVPADFPTISQAVADAGPGDRILVAKGLYAENVVVPAGRDGLAIIAKGKVVIDALADGGAGPGFRVSSDGVRIEGFTIRHAEGGAGGHGVFGEADDLVLVDLTVLHAAGAGLKVTGNRARVVDCGLIGCSGGLEIAGNDAFVDHCEVMNDGGYGVGITGHDSTVRRCTVLTIEDGYGIKVVGNRARLESNEVIETDEVAIDVTGDDFRILGNRVRYIGDDTEAIAVRNCTRGLVAGNWCRDVVEFGILVAPTATGVTVRKNRVERCGTEADPGIEVDGHGNELVKNVAMDGQGDGIQVNGDDNLVRKNKVLRNLEDGIDCEGDRNVIDRNVATGNLAEGLENNGSDTIFTANVAKKNRLDVANDGTFATFAGNQSKTGGETTAPEIDG